MQWPLIAATSTSGIATHNCRRLSFYDFYFFCHKLSALLAGSLGMCKGLMRQIICVLPHGMFWYRWKNYRDRCTDTCGDIYISFPYIFCQSGAFFWYMQRFDQTKYDSCFASWMFRYSCNKYWHRYTDTHGDMIYLLSIHFSVMHSCSFGMSKCLIK